MIVAPRGAPRNGTPPDGASARSDLANRIQNKQLGHASVGRGRDRARSKKGARCLADTACLSKHDGLSTEAHGTRRFQTAFHKEKSPGRNPGFSLVQGPTIAAGMSRHIGGGFGQVWSTGLPTAWCITGNSAAVPLRTARFNSFFKKARCDGGLMCISASIRR